MVLPTGTISFNDIQNEFGGSNPISLNEYYYSSDNSSKYAYGVTAVPASGQISMSSYRGVSKQSVPAEITYSAGVSTYVNEQNGITKEINIYTHPLWTQTIRIYVNGILLSTSIVYARNYAPFAVTQNTNDGGYYVTLLFNLAFDGQPNTNRHIYWRRTGEFFVNIVYSRPP